ncbi:hypothetical protein EI983_06070 [Roseovarius faecimaris]|uniref:DUF4274 domain-containing protein n=1 Tax=Roseovarius faecimaris TaxID=2494550 RepID=A0A6I6IPW9_9RHOB|nr:hypothetical protein [Roseovarius faecimaris]QGX97863.1 hypothetical protein EI983_06070 [Roseovarius faecimaris]
MSDSGEFDWSTGTAEDQQALARGADADQLRHAARTYRWTLYPEEVLGWVMAQKCIDLASALSAFLNGEPERFNYMPKRDVPQSHRAAARVLDNICLRVNSGFYLVEPGHDLDDDRRLKRWLDYQQVDREEGRRGRWILDERIINGLYETQELPCSVQIQTEKRNVLLDVFSPVMELGVNREHLKYLPEEG